jgi:sigma-B regulation protein RsbU (phosphoserine phosphatase)
MQSGVFNLIDGPSVAIDRLKMSLNFFASISAFLFFEAGGFAGRAGRLIVYAVCLSELCLIAAIFLGVPLPLLDQSNSVLVIVSSASLVFLAFRQPAIMTDAIVFRAGMVAFVGLVLWTNVVVLLGHRATYEFYGFAVLMCSLGYVAARRALDRDQQLGSIQQELEIARRIQLSILPAASPAAKHFSIAARYKPMTSVAGDFYDFLEDENGSVGLLIADVSGHGVPAALIASMIKVAIQTHRHRYDDPAGLLAGVNEILCGNAQHQFVTAGYVYLNPNRDEFCYAAAGHPPMILRRSRQIFLIEENGLVLALLPSAAYTSTTQPLEPGDRILLCTDGIIEAANANEEEFGQNRLGDLLLECGGKTAEQTAHLIEAAVTAWSSTQNDDLTIIVCDYKPISRE